MSAPSVLMLVGAVFVAVFAGTAGRTLPSLLRARRHGFGTPADEATFRALHTISRASPSLRAGLTRESARRAARHLRALLGAEAVALVAVRPADDDAGADADAEEADGELLVWDGEGGDRHSAGAACQARPVLNGGRPRVLTPDALTCDDPACRIRVGMLAPLTVEGRVTGVLAVYGPSASAARVRAVGEVARWVAGQLELAELDSSRARLAEAEMRALRAQISPHFVYNSLTTIASFVRTDPERARELLLDFADFARYSFRNPRDFTTLADELRSIDRYLLLERARFGDRLHFSVEVAPEVLPVAVPFLSLQPLVENSIRHGMEGARTEFHIKIVARDAGPEATISVEDDGVGMDPERLRGILSAGALSPGPGRDRGGAGIGLANVDERMRQVYGDEYGLTVETAPGAGTKVSLRVPKYRPGVFPD
ncbi:sensor histidine kinase [Actinomadura namibiensis]|uniref:histidine kinase n=1 Tax=Actinomadura namibiensis TaxID=182080 RepID=A0A7W3QNC5_ACTNM|nr:histidine kinase [Actinomadura namibiensis]MBA8953517.1 two-component system LytT family sensor kinase [Actinomadura namibiensis]